MECEWFPWDSARKFADAPRPLVALLGEVETHRLLIQNLPRRSSFSFSSLALDHVFPQSSLLPDSDSAPLSPEASASPPRYSDPPRDAEGVLPLDWALEYFNPLPALVVLVFRADGLDAEEVICSAVERFRRNNPAGFRIYREVLLLLSSSPVDVASSTLSNLWKKAGLSSKKAVVSVNTANLKDSLIKLETVIVTGCSDYYKDCQKSLRKSKDVLADSLRKMQSRVSIQLGLLAQTFGDLDAALANFGTALDQIGFLYGTPSAFEAGNIASILVLCKCRILFQVGRFNDAVEAFLSHISNLKTISFDKERPQLLFRQYGLLENLHKTFAELLDMFPSPMALGNRTHHSSFHYYLAFRAAGERRESAYSIISQWPPVSEYDESLLIERNSRRQFFGKLSNDSDDELLVSVWLESKVNHSDCSLELLKKAYHSAKRISSDRLILLLGFEMAKEYHRRGDFKTAFDFFDSLLPKYRQEKWSFVLANILVQAHETALAMENYSLSAQYAIEFLHTSIDCSSVVSDAMIECGPVEKRQAMYERFCKSLESLGAFDCPISFEESHLAMFGEPFV
jgi:tetratricopeptide (TPR) repeat protein